MTAPMSFPSAGSEALTASACSGRIGRHGEHDPPQPGQTALKGVARAVILVVGILSLHGLAHPAAANPRQKLQDFLDSGHNRDCLDAYHALRDVLDGGSSDRRLQQRGGLWPGWFFCAARCSKQPNVDAVRARNDARRLLEQGHMSAAILTCLFASHCFMGRSWRHASDLLTWLREKEASSGSDDWSRELWPLVSQYHTYLSHSDLLYDTATSPKTRPGIVIAPFNLPHNHDFPQDPDAASAAVTWLIIESLNRILEDHQLDGGTRAMTVSEDLALRFQGGRITGVNSRFDLPVESDDLNFRYPRYMEKIHDYGRVFVGGYLSTNGRTLLAYNNLNPDSTWTGARSSERPYSGSHPKEYKYTDMGGLALDAALNILANFRVAPGTRPIPNPGKVPPHWLAMPVSTDDRLFLLFVEAVGFETRGNFHRAAIRYAEILETRPARAVESEWSFMAARHRWCSELASFDTHDRFLRANDELFRRVLGEMIR